MDTLIHYTKGDATQPQQEGNNIIVHVCNDIGGWGRGFVLALSRRWKEPEQQYRAWFASQEDFALGNVQFVQVEAQLWVANLIGQRGIKSDQSGNPPLRYDALAQGLRKVADYASTISASVHMPRIGCGLASGRWEEVEPLITLHLIQNGISVTVYDL